VPKVRSRAHPSRSGVQIRDADGTLRLHVSRLRSSGRTKPTLARIRVLTLSGLSRAGQLAAVASCEYKRNMRLFSNLLGKLVAWLANGQNATVVLVFITTWYVLLTRRMAKAAFRQTTAMLQPTLSLGIHYGKGHGDFAPEGHFTINNLGSQPVVLLDVRLRCLPMGGSPLEKTYGDDYIVSPHDVISREFSFRDELHPMMITTVAYSYQLLVVAADVGRQVVAEYELLPVIGMQMCRLKYPMTVRWKYVVRSLKWRYYEIHSLFKRKHV